MTELTTALVEQAERTAAPTVYDLIQRMRPELAKQVPDADRFARTVLTEIRRTPKLLDCSPESLLGAMMQAAQLGLEPGPLGHVYLVPFKREVTFVLGYRGMIDLAYRSGLLKSISAVTVREGDAFAFRYGSRPFLDHTPSGPPGERVPTHWYAVAPLKTGGAPFVVIYPDDVEKARKLSAAGNNPLSPWTTDYDAMARKTAVRQLSPLLPQSPAWAQALAEDELPAEPLSDVLSGPETGGDV